jgi:two-component system, OmpR family, sensor kinase
VAELLELARLDRPTSLDLAETDLSGLVRDAVADACAVEPGRLMRAEAPEEFPAVVDEARIRQVLANLVANVREHTPPGTPAVVRLAQAHGGVLLEVADAGPGMSPADAARAFDRFHRAAGDHGPAGSVEAGALWARGEGGPDSGGSGLGLAIVQAIAQAHGGYARLDSDVGRGTRVQVWIPRTDHD